MNIQIKLPKWLFSILLQKLFILNKLKKRLKYDSNYFCPYCGSCGIIECCRPSKYIYHPKGHYCKYYQETYNVSEMTLTVF